MIDIRRAIKTDYDVVAKLLQEFHAAAAGEEIVPFDFESARKTVDHLNNLDTHSARGAVFVADDDGAIVGTIAAVLIPVFVNFNVTSCHEAFWFVSSSARSSGVGLSLLYELEGWARRQGAKTLTMVSWHGSQHEAMNNVYTNMGFRPMEYHYWKALT